MKKTLPAPKQDFTKQAVKLPLSQRNLSGLVAVAWEKKFGGHIIAEVKRPAHKMS